MSSASVRTNQPHLVAILLEHGANANYEARIKHHLSNDCNTMSPLHCAATLGQNSYEVLCLLLNAPDIKVNNTNFDGRLFRKFIGTMAILLSPSNTDIFKMYSSQS